MKATPRSIRPHIAIFGRRNVGKSSIINALTEQNIALVSDVAGTTADPVYKNMELVPMGPVVIIDTAGLDDVGELGKMRVEASRNILKKTDLALVVIEPLSKLHKVEEELLDVLKTDQTKFLVLINKCDNNTAPASLVEQIKTFGTTPIEISAKNNIGIHELRATDIQNKLKDFSAGTIVSDIVKPGQTIILVVPIDLSAPKGRLILPQVQTIRELLDSDCIVIVAKETELKSAIANLKVPPALVITDSQVFQKVAEDVPSGIPFTSFSVLFARYKGDLQAYLHGVNILKTMSSKANILIAESCTHHQVEDDIGRVKIPKWLRKKYGEELKFEFCQGVSFPENLSEYDLVVQCGGCMTNRKAILSRIEECQAAGVGITNYGILIAHIHGVLDEAIKPFDLLPIA